jgi:hypothetical protein
MPPIGCNRIPVIEWNDDDVWQDCTAYYRLGLYSDPAMRVLLHRANEFALI